MQIVLKVTDVTATISIIAQLARTTASPDNQHAKVALQDFIAEAEST